MLGAHCDDIAIGMGGTLLTLSRANPGLRVHALVLCGGGTDREAEERAALAAFCPGADVHLTVLDLPDGRAPAHWDRIKDALSDVSPQLRRRTWCSRTQRDDAHQDHRLLAELIPTEFRDHLVLGYEILKWETDTPTPDRVSPAGPDDRRGEGRGCCTSTTRRRSAATGSTSTSFLGLSRLRGVQCRSPHAEAFVVEKAGHCRFPQKGAA